MRKIFIDTILKYAETNSTPYLLTGDLGYSVLEPFRDKHPSNFINVGIMEQSMISIAAGIASQGNKVFAYSIANFATFRALEQLRLDIAYHNLDVCVVGVGTGFQYGTAGYSHWAVEDLAIVSALERFTIYSPSDAYSTETVLLDFLKHGKPTYIRLGKHRKNLEDINSSAQFMKNIRIFGTGKKYIASHGSIALNILESKYFNVQEFSLIVFDEIPCRLDVSFIEIFKVATSIKILEDVIFSGSLGSRVSRFIVEHNLSIPFSWIGVNGKDIASAGGSEDYLRSRELGDDYIKALFKTN